MRVGNCADPFTMTRILASLFAGLYHLTYFLDHNTRGQLEDPVSRGHCQLDWLISGGDMLKPLPTHH